MNFNGLQRFSGSVSAFGSYGLPSIAGYRIDPRIAAFVAILGALFLLRALGIIEDHGFALMAAGPVTLLRSLEEDHKKLADERAELEAKAEEAKSFDEVRDRLDEIEPQLAKLEGDISREKGRQGRIKNAPAVPTSDGNTEGIVTPLGGFTPLAAPLGQQFVGAEDWQAFIKRNPSFSPDAQVQGPKIRVQGSVIEALRGMRNPRLRGVSEVVMGGDATSAGALVIPGQSGIFDEAYARPLTLLDVITRGTVTSDSVEYVRVVGATNNAAAVPEASKIDGGNESPVANASHKPWSALELVRINEPVKTIAHGVPATKRALSDPGQMRTIIDTFLRYGLQEELEDQIISGQGTGEDFDGIYDVATGSQPFHTNRILTLRKAKTKVRTGGRGRPNAIAINPEDVDAIYEEALTDDAPGMAGILLELSQGRLHSLPLVETEAVQVGAPIVADWRLAVLWDREQATIEATSGYMDFFMRNLVAVLGELRAAFGVIRPAAFVIAEIGS